MNGFTVTVMKETHDFPTLDAAQAFLSERIRAGANGGRIEDNTAAPQQTETRHAFDCSRAFGIYDATCPRCVELKNGAPARKGWGHRSRRAYQEAARVDSIRRHDCKASQCGPVCTFGEW